MDQMPWPAPGKVNRFLRIVGRRADGYHLLQTIFHLLDRCDYLAFEPRADGLIVRHGEIIGIAPAEDLCVKAARLLQKACGVTRGVAITLDKRLPIGGGLGGGSSDAATTLVALNHYWKLGLSWDQLAAFGLELGADVPVFVRGQSAWAEGIGEQLTPLALDEAWFLVVVPSCSVATKEIFSDSKLTRNSQPITIRDFIAGKAGNDCAPVVYRRYPQIAATAAWLSRYGEPYLTGTGACLFALFPDRQTADYVARQMPDHLTGFVARGLTHSPLHKRLHLVEN